MARERSALVFNLVSGGKPPGVKSAVESSAAGRASEAVEPVMPDGFAGARAAKWEAVVAMLRERGTLSHEFGDLIRLYVIAFVEAAEARANVDANGPIVAQPRTGAPIHNPYRAVAREAEATVAKLAGELGLTPASRKRALRPHG